MTAGHDLKAAAGALASVSFERLKIG